MDEWINVYERFLVNEGVKEETVYSYTKTIREFLLFVEERAGQPLSADQLSPESFLSYREEIEGEFAASTVNKRLAGLRKFIQMLQQQKVWPYQVSLNDVKIVRRPKRLKADEVGFIIEAIEKESDDFIRSRDRCMMFLMLYEGLRIGECLELKLSTVQQFVQNEKLSPALNEWMELRTAHRFASSSFLFVSQKSERVTIGAVNNMIKRIRLRSGVHFNTEQLRDYYRRRIAE